MQKNIKSYALWVGFVGVFFTVLVMLRVQAYKQELDQPQVLANFSHPRVAGINTASHKHQTPLPAISSFIATPQTINAGQSSTLSWNASDANRINIVPGNFFSTRESGSTSVRPNATTTYTLTATNNTGFISATTQLTVNASNPAPTPNPPPPSPSASLQWGAYVGDSLSDAPAFESLVGHKMNIQSLFTGWGSTDGPFPSEYGPSVRDQGKTLVIFWEPYGTTLDDINAGQSDSYIKQFAAAAKAYGGPVILVPMPEMNGNWDPGDATMADNTPASFIAAWQHIHDFFSGISNVKFGWDVNNVSEPDISSNAIPLYYPGDAYVDYVGVDGFNFGNPWQSVDQTFSPALDLLKTYNKPIYLFSIACLQGSQKAGWISSIPTELAKYPLVSGWVWFNQNKEQNWLVNSDPNSLTAFKSIIP